MKCGQQQPALAQMLIAVEEQRRPLAHERAQRAVGVASMKTPGVAEKDLAHRSRVAGEDERRDSRYAHGEPIAVAARAFVEEPKRIADEIESREERWAGREGIGGRHAPYLMWNSRWFHTSFGIDTVAGGDPCTHCLNSLLLCWRRARVEDHLRRDCLPRRTLLLRITKFGINGPPPAALGSAAASPIEWGRRRSLQ